MSGLSGPADLPPPVQPPQDQQAQPGPQQGHGAEPIVVALHQITAAATAPPAPAQRQQSRFCTPTRTTIDIPPAKMQQAQQAANDLQTNLETFLAVDNQLGVLDVNGQPAANQMLTGIDCNLTNLQIKYKKVNGEIGYIQIKSDNPAHRPILDKIKELKDLYKEVYGRYPKAVDYGAGVVTFYDGRAAFKKRVASIKESEGGIKHAKQCFSKALGAVPDPIELNRDLNDRLRNVKTKTLRLKGEVNAEIIRLKTVRENNPHYSQIQKQIAALQVLLDVLNNGVVGFSLGMAALYRQSVNATDDVESMIRLATQIEDAIVAYSRSREEPSNIFSKTFDSQAKKTEREMNRREMAKAMAADIIGLIYADKFSTEGDQVKAQFDFREFCVKLGVESPGSNIEPLMIANYLIDDNADPNRSRDLLAASLKFDRSEASNNVILSHLIP